MVLPVGGLDVLEVIGILFVVLIDLLAEQRDGVSAKSNKVGSGCSTLVELRPCNPEVGDSGQVLSSFCNVGEECQVLHLSFLFLIINSLSTSNVPQKEKRNA